MKSLGRFILWSLVFLLLLAALDRLLVQVPFKAPVLAQGRAFYIDFRERVLNRHTPLPRKKAPEKAPSPPSRRSSAPSPRYVYVDEGGSIQFADTLEEIPAPLRGEARSLTR